ncbi:Hypothetical protein CINCED_3A025954 [Cinara cedri]|uniref:Uncharacterized protein n=1 Tax=Cinara cedri TaxID=506608 RepID=A0A5E4N3Z8_9HEMI|nr:Hypothetical protein CINCED_3A025954 [Cinara cedri]
MVLFSYGLPLSKQLQQIKIDLRKAAGTAVIDNVNAPKTRRNNIDVEFHKIFKKKMVEFLDVTISIKDLNKGQQNRANQLNDKNELYPETYF